MDIESEYLYEIQQLFKWDPYEKVLKYTKEIEKNTCYAFYSYEKYSDLVYTMEWPGEDEKQALEKAHRNYADMQPILLRGVVVDNQILEENGCRRLQIVDKGRFGGEKVTDSQTLHFLRDTGGIEYTLYAFLPHPDCACTIGRLKELRPGTKIILALTNLEIFSSTNLKAFFVDVAVDANPAMIYLDDEYKIHKASDYQNLYRKLSTAETVAHLTETQKKIEEDPLGAIREMAKESVKENVAKSGCYIATSVYGSYDCPEVWTLRRFRDQVLAKARSGRLFIRIYYAISPTLVKWFGNTGWFQNFWRTKLDSMVLHLQSKGIKSDRYDDMH